MASVGILDVSRPRPRSPSWPPRWGRPPPATGVHIQSLAFPQIKSEKGGCTPPDKVLCLVPVQPSDVKVNCLNQSQTEVPDSVPHFWILLFCYGFLCLTHSLYLHYLFLFPSSAPSSYLRPVRPPTVLWSEVCRILDSAFYMYSVSSMSKVVCVSECVCERACVHARVCVF